MSGDIVPITPQQVTPAPTEHADLDSWVDVMRPILALAEKVYDTDFVPKGLRGSAPATAAAMLYGREVGLPPMTSLNVTHVVDGRPGLSAEAMRALVFAAGHDLEFTESTGAICTMRARRHGQERWTEVTWTSDMARAAGLLGGKRDNWTKYPRAMLQARATTELCRMVFPDVIHGFRSIEELEDLIETTGEPSVQQKSTTTVRRKPAGKVRAATVAAVPALPSTPGPPLPGEPGYTPEQPVIPSPAEAPPPGHPGTASPGVGAVPPAGPDYPAQPDPIDLPVQARQSSRHVEPKSDAPPLDGAPEQEATPEVHHGSSGVAAPTLPPLEPETPPEEPVKGPVPISDGFRRGMLGAWRKVAPVEPNAELNRMRRLEAWSDIVGREVTTSTDLTRDEGWRIAQAINRVEDGDAVVVEQADGWLRVRDWPDVAPTEPPDDDPELAL